MPSNVVKYIIIVISNDCKIIHPLYIFVKLHVTVVVFTEQQIWTISPIINN